MEDRITPYYLVLLSIGDNYALMDRYTEDHIRFVDTLISKSILFIGGDLFLSGGDDKNIPSGLTSAYLLKTKNKEEAINFMQQDPFIIHHILTPTLLQWNLIGMEDDD